MDGPDRIYVAWTGARADSATQSFGTGVFVRTWTPATGWSYLGPAVTETAYAGFKYYTEVDVLALNGTAFRATRANDDTNGMHTVIGVERWTGAAWEPEVFRLTQDSPVQTAFDPQTVDMWARAPFLEGNQTGKVVLVWTEWDATFDPDARFEAPYIARRSNLAGWSPFYAGSTLAEGNLGFQELRSDSAKAIVAPNGDVYLLWSAYVAGHRTVQVRRDSAGAWLPPTGWSGQIATANEDDGGVSAVSDTQNRLYLAWTHVSDLGTSQYVARLDPDGALREIGTGSASGGGLSGTTLRTSGAQIGLDAAEYPVVVWNQEGRPHAKRWDGLEWREHGLNGAPDVLGDQLPAGAVVNTMKAAIAGNRLCVAWASVLSVPATPPSLRVTCTTTP